MNRIIVASLIMFASVTFASAQAERGPPGERWNGERWDGRDLPIDGHGHGGSGEASSAPSYKYDPIHNAVDNHRGWKFPVDTKIDPVLTRALREYENRP